MSFSGLRWDPKASNTGAWISIFIPNKEAQAIKKAKQYAPPLNGYPNNMPGPTGLINLRKVRLSPDLELRNEWKDELRRRDQYRDWYEEEREYLWADRGEEDEEWGSQQEGRLDAEKVEKLRAHNAKRGGRQSAS
jgi:hypothetical protein